MDRRIAKFRAMRKSKALAMKDKIEEENRGKLEIIFPLLLMLERPRTQPWKTYSAMNEWLKNRYKERDEIVQHLESVPTIHACYYDARGLTFEVSRKRFSETCLLINRHFGLYGVLFKYTVKPYGNGSKIDTAYSPVHRVSRGGKVAMLAGIFVGRHVFETGITVRHLITDVFTDLDRPPDATEDYEELDVGGGLVGKCCGMEREVVVGGKTYTADIAAISLLPSSNGPVAYERFSETEIDGQIYQSRFWIGDEFSLEPDTEVWLVNQDGDLKKGKIHRHLVYDKILKLYNVMQILSENSGNSFSMRGDSGGRIFLPPTGADHMVHVIGMVSSEVVYDNGLRLTTGVWLGKVLPAFLRALPAPLRLKGPHPLSRDYNLPFGVDYAEGLEFYGSAGVYDNETVTSIQPSFSENDRSEVNVVRLKESGPTGGLVESYNCTPVECSEDSLKTDDINGDSGVVSEVDAPANVGGVSLI